MICRIVRMNHFSLFQLNLRKPQENPQVDAMWRGMRKIRNLSERASSILYALMEASSAHCPVSLKEFHVYVGSFIRV